MLKILSRTVLLVVTIYLILPTHTFPRQPHDSVQSLEQADTETPWRRAYFTDYTREESREYYLKQMKTSYFMLPMLAFVLNYPPEDSFKLIRDQVRSTGLEEIVIPFRESLFVDYFEPKDPKDAVGYRGSSYRQKITVKYVTSSLFARVPIVFTALFLFWFLVKEVKQTFSDILIKCFKK